MLHSPPIFNRAGRPEVTEALINPYPESFLLVTEDVVNHFARTFIEIHVYAALFSAIVAAETGILAGLFSYLAAIHLLAATVYVLDVRYSSLAQVLLNLLLQQFGLTFDPYRGITSRESQ